VKNINYDIVIIGGGAAGLTCAKLAKGMGKKVLLIEKNNIGGECTWTGCIPSKTLIHVANSIHDAESLEKIGINLIRSIDSENIMRHVRSTIQAVYERETEQDLEKIGIDVLKGTAYFLDGTTIMCSGIKITTKKCIIATGSSPFIPPIDGLDSVSYLTNQTIFALKKLPKSMIIVGGGPIGVELASALNRLSVKITIVESFSRILAKEDKELVAILSKQLVKEGIQINNETQAIKVAQEQNAILLTCTNKTGEKTIQAESLLIAVGRQPNINELDLAKAGVQYTQKGIVVSSTLQTTAHSIYACGDVVGPYQFSHIAHYQATIATRNALIPFFKKRINYENIAWVTFTDPELAHAGLTEEQALKRYGGTIKMYRSNLATLDRAVTDGKTIGLAKFICDKNNKILGAQILGPRAGELIHEIQIGKKLNTHFQNYFFTIHAYPTYSELIWQASKTCYIEKLQNNFFIKCIKKILQF